MLFFAVYLGCMKFEDVIREVGLKSFVDICTYDGSSNRDGHIKTLWFGRAEEARTHEEFVGRTVTALEPYIDDGLRGANLGGTPVLMIYLAPWEE